MRRLGEPEERFDVDAETTTVGLYDVSTVARICPMLNDLKISKESAAWKLKPKSNERFLVLASCSDIAVFTLGETTEYLVTLGLEGTITDFVILGSSAFCVAIVEKRTVVVLSLEKPVIYFKQEAPYEVDFVACNPTSSVCYLTFGSRSGEWYTVTMQGDVAAPKENNRVENWQEEQIQEFFLLAMQRITSKDMDMENVSDEITLIANGPMQSYASEWVRVRDGGRFSLNLDTDGWVHVFDPSTHSFWTEFDLKIDEADKILDFAVVDKNEYEVPKLFAIVATNGSGTTQIIIHDRTKKENIFSLASVPSTTLFAYGGSDRVLMAVEEVIDEKVDEGEKSRIVLRQVSQSRPEMRFEALLKNNRFEEAEKFAKTFNLDVQKVYKSHVYYLRDNCDDDDEAFATLMRTMEAITEHNWVAETYFTLVTTSRRCDRIRTYLSYAKKRKIADLEVFKMIESVCYTWATYRIITGPGQHETGGAQISETIWDLFVDALHGGDPWLLMYEEFIAMSQFTKARVIFSRHGQSIIADLCSDDDHQTARLEALFRMFTDGISANIGNWSSVVEHITTDIFPACLMAIEDLVPCLENLITTLIPLLEYRDSANWPDNAIKAASCYDTMAKVLVDNGNTPASQSLLLLCGSKLTAASSADGSSSMSRIKKLFYDLHELKRLKEIYECSISFTTFQSLEAEGICHKILQNALSNPNTTHAKIEKFVKPFMAERNLNQEQTIVNYIQIMSGAAVSNANIYGWEKQCVQLCASLSDETRRCCSIISIAANAKIPWPVELNEAVNKILVSRTLSRSEIEEMQMVCKRTELSKMLSSYGYGRHEIELITLPDASMDIILTIRCMLAQREKPSRFVDSIKLLELLMAMQGAKKKTIKAEYVQSLAVIHMMSHEDVTTSMINYIDSLGDRERVKTISLVFSFIERVADTPAAENNVEERAKMLGVGEELLSYYACRDNDYNDPERRLKQNLVLVREVQKGQKTAVLLSDFQNCEWQHDFVEKLLASNEPLTVKLNRCNYMGIPMEGLITMMLDKAMRENDMASMVDSISTYVDSISPWTDATRDMLDPIPHLLSWITYRLPELSVNETESVRADDIAFVIKKLGRVVRETIRKFPFDVISDDLNYLLQLEAFFNLGEHIIKQSLRGQENETEKQEMFGAEDVSVALPSTSSSSTSALNCSLLRIFGFKHSFGTYDFSGDPALFEGVSGVLALAQVAPSVARPFDSDISDEDANDFRANWEQLNMFLAMHQQDLLDISARVFAGSLKCWSGQYREGIIHMDETIVSVIERMLQQKKFDFWHAFTLLSGIPAERLDKVVQDLQRRPGVKSSAKATLQYLQLAFVMCIATNNFEKMSMIIHYYEQKFLVKKLAEEGIRANIALPDFVDKVVQQAVELKQPMPPYRLYDYVKKYVEKMTRATKVTVVSVGEYMVRYATLLIRKASAAGKTADLEIRNEEIAKFVELARTSLRIAEEENAKCISHYLRSLLYIVCPYNYEVIQFVVASFGNYATEVKDQEFHENLQSIMTFLWSYARSNHVSREESVWFTKRESILVKDEKDFEKTSRFNEPFGYGLRQTYEDDGNAMSDSINSGSGFPTDAMVYEQNSVIISDMPSLAMEHLPFHAFLLRKKEDCDETVMAIVKAELSIFNVPVWQAYLHEVEWLSKFFSRAHLLSSAIFAHANKYAMFGKSLPAGERNTIFHLLNNTRNHRRVVISTIALLFKKIILSDVKIELLQMGVDISEQWTTDVSGEEKEDIEEQCARLRDGIAKFFTELELKKNGLYNEKTADNVENVEELCSLIYDEMVEWANSTDAAKKCQVVERIAKANGLDLAALHERLVFAWIEDTETSVIPMSHVDMNESIGGTSFMDQKEDASEKNELRMPLFDTALDKVIVLCQKLDKNRLLKKLIAILLKGGRRTMGAYTAAVRTTCIILRTFTEKDIEAFSPGADLMAMCGTLEMTLYNRLFDKAEVKSDPNAEKVQLIKTLLQCPSRSHPMTALIACLIIDHEYSDPKSIEQVMTRLQISKQWDVLRALLNYVRNNRMDSIIRSFPLLWFRVYENALIELNGGPMATTNWNYEQCVMLRKWTLWAMSSNVEGGRQPNITRFLRDISCPVAASVVSVLSNWTVEKMDDVDSSKVDAQRDICLDWNTGNTSTSAGNSTMA
ncbi:unnamed protein product [Caenorhabditis sp. 36 PRJEB53466]|nr:unnamed protein product [Caenorhabditis sp. 36 PRJEB53466]